MVKRRFIQIEPSQRRHLAKMYRVSLAMVSYALSFNKERDNSKAKMIRHTALTECSGVPMVIAPECETIHVDDTWMIQVFDNGVELRCHKKNGSVEVWKNGTLTEQHNNVTLTELARLQARAEEMK